MEKFLIQRLKSNKRIVGIATFCGKCERSGNEYDYETEDGFLNNKHELDMFEYAYLSECELRIILNKNQEDIF